MALEPLLGFLQGLDREEFGRLQAAVQRLLAIADSVAFDASVFAESLAAQDRFGLSPQDAIVYASVVLDLRTRLADEQKLFVSGNWKDFNDPDLIAELHQYSCRYEERYSAVLEQIHVPG